MIRMIRNAHIRGVGYTEGDTYEGPDEALMVNIGRAVYVESDATPAPERREEAEQAPEPKKKRGRPRKAIRGDT